MNLADVMEEVAEKLSTISGLRVYPYPPDAVTSPSAVVSYPEDITFDSTYGRGMDRLNLPLLVLVAKPYDRATRDQLAVYCNGSGPASVKAALEVKPCSSFDSLRVVSTTFDVVTVAAVDYLAALFTLDITGQGG